MIPEKEFWNKKYSEGGISGRGSIGKYRAWKWKKIKNVIGNFKSVVDVGCGDLSFWEHRIPRGFAKQKDFNYLGVDISKNIISRNRKIFSRFKDVQFVCNPAYILLNITKVDVVLCMDLLFHIMDNFRFELIIDNLCKYSKEWIVIYTWEKNPFELQRVVTDGVSQYFRPLKNYKHIFDMNSFDLHSAYPVPFDDWGSLYFLRSLLY